MSNDPKRNDIREAFEAFMIADDALPVSQAFQVLLERSGCADGTEITLATLASAVEPSLPFKHQKLLKLLREAESRARRCQGAAADDPSWETKTDTNGTKKKKEKKGGKKKVVVSGAGPCGLRAAIEARLLGMEVTCVERRTCFTRHNIIKTSAATVEDMISLGLQVHFPSFSKHGLLHIGTREIQLVLLKALLLLGGTVVYDRVTLGIVHPHGSQNGPFGRSADGRFRALVLPAKEALAHRAAIEEEAAGDRSDDGDHRCDDSTGKKDDDHDAFSLNPCETDTTRLQKESKVDFFEKATSTDGAVFGGPGRDPAAAELQPPLSGGEKRELHPFDAILIAEGESSRLIRNLGFDRRVTRFAPAVGIVANFAFTPGASPGCEERKLPEFVLGSNADEARRLREIASRAGVELENLEYMRGSTHFLVGTISLHSLGRAGVVRDVKGRKIRDVLGPGNVDTERLRRLARSLARAAGVPDSAPFAERNAVHIFDFSCKGRCVQQCRVLSAGAGTALVLPVGDALQNPFWPQGLGVNRGFHSSLDAVWTAFMHPGIDADADGDCVAAADDDGNDDRGAGNSANREESPAWLVRALEERQWAWKACDWGTFRPTTINPAKEWTADPASRYARWIWVDMDVHARGTRAERPPSGIMSRVA